MAAVMTMMRTTGAAGTTGAVGPSWSTGASGALGERLLEDALQLGGLIAGQLAAGHFVRNQAVDL